MKERKGKLARIILLIAVLVIAAVFVIIKVYEANYHGESYYLDIETEDLSYVVYDAQGCSSVTYDYGYDEYQEMLDEVFEVLSGEYELTGTYDLSEYDDGGVDIISLYDSQDSLITEIICSRSGEIYLLREGESNVYDVYTKEGGSEGIEFLYESAVSMAS